MWLGNYSPSTLGKPTRHRVSPTEGGSDNPDGTQKDICHSKAIVHLDDRSCSTPDAHRPRHSLLPLYLLQLHLQKTSSSSTHVTLGVPICWRSRVILDGGICRYPSLALLSRKRTLLTSTGNVTMYLKYSSIDIRSSLLERPRKLS